MNHNRLVAELGAERASVLCHEAGATIVALQAQIDALKAAPDQQSTPDSQQGARDSIRPLSRHWGREHVIEVATSLGLPSSISSHPGVQQLVRTIAHEVAQAATVQADEQAAADGFIALSARLVKEPDGTHKAFSGMKRKERHALSANLRNICSELERDCRWVPQLREGRVFVCVSSHEEAVAVQEALIRLGCGFHNGDYENRSREVVKPRGVVTAIHVCSLGTLGLSLNSDADARHLETLRTEGKAKEVTVAAVMAAERLADL